LRYRYQAGKSVFFSKGVLIKPIMASCCIPVVFEPLRLEGGIYADGGLLNNLPVEPLLDKCDFIIGIHTNPINTALRLLLSRQSWKKFIISYSE
jgi:NTE family protein